MFSNSVFSQSKFPKRVILESLFPKNVAVKGVISKGVYSENKFPKRIFPESVFPIIWQNSNITADYLYEGARWGQLHSYIEGSDGETMYLTAP